jgi:predicted MFS family arabinose efflux permease
VARERRLGRLVSRDRDDVTLEVPLPRGGGTPGPPHLLTKNRQFLWLVLGDSFAQLARWGFFLALIGDATYRLDANAAEVASLIAAYAVPLIVVSPLHGAVADRWSAKWLLVITSTAALPLPLIAFSTDSLGWLYLAAILYGVLFSATMPARGALVPRLVAADQLVRANGMISAVGSVQMIIGPGVAALLATSGGPRAPYFVTLVASAAAALVFLFLVPDRRAERSRTRGRIFADIGAGFREAAREPTLRRMFILGICVWFLVGQLITLEPSYIKTDLGLGQDFLGLVWTVFGVGELIGSVLLTRVRQGAGRELVLAARGLLVAGVGFLTYISVAIGAAAIVANVVFGIGFPFFVASSNALIQRVARAPGKVTAAFSMVGESGAVMSALLLILVGSGISVRIWLLVSGVLFTLVAMAALRMSRRVTS